MRSLTLEGKITIFKTLAISKIIHLASVTVLPNSTITELNKIHKDFSWIHQRPKIKEKTVINNFDKGGLKNVDISSKITSLQCSWVKRLFDRNFHDWRIIPHFLFQKNFGKNFEFHGSLDIPQFKKMPEFYREILLNWSKFLSYDPSVPSTILPQYLWLNKHIKIGNNSAYFSHFSNHGINFIGNLVDINGRYKSWDTIKYEYNLTDKEKFR